MKVVVWNMAHKASNWDVLESWDETTGADISLLSEATPNPARAVVGADKTIGLEEPLGPERPIDRPWAALVASSHPMHAITDARLDRHYKQPLPFKPSRPGTWAAASIDVEGVQVTAISLYGLMDEKSDASVHRSLSELSPIFDHESYGKRLLLGGDLNILAGRPKGPHLDRHQVVLARIEAYGLVDCLKEMRARGPLEGCLCDLGEECTHTWTKRDPQRPAVPYQDDYLFASKWLASRARLNSCKALPFQDDAPSDHTPIVAEFALSR